MKKILLSIISVLCSLTTVGQDVIVMQNGDEIPCKLVEVGVENIKYKRLSNLNGPTFVEEKDDVFMIKYQNGEKDLLYKEPAPAPAPEPTVTPLPSNLAENKIEIKPTKKLTPIKFDGYLFAGATFDKSSGGPTIDLSLGVNLFEHLYLGAEVGFCTNFEKFYLKFCCYLI